MLTRNNNFLISLLKERRLIMNIYFTQHGFVQLVPQGCFAVCFDTWQGGVCPDLLQQAEELDLQQVKLMTAYVKTAKNANFHIKLSLSFNSIIFLQ
tara:strand:+ start:822 stop:1109 length:288 start_codon:yes stop_codon:yes gene_type:complete